MAKFRSEVFFRRFRGRLRPLSHYSLGWLPRWTRLVTRIPGVASIGNTLLSVGILRRMAFHLMGLDPRRQIAPLQGRTFRSQAGLAVATSARAGAFNGPGADPAAAGVTKNGYSLDTQVAREDTVGERGYVVLWADSFSDTLESRGAADMVRVLQAQGFTVLLAPDVCCGLTWITTGQLESARGKLTELVAALAPFAVNGIPIVGIEPSCTAVLRDDLVELLPKDPRALAVKKATVTLAELLATVPADQRVLPDLTGVEVVAQPHCHHYSVMGWAADRALLTSIGAHVTELSGCCGLAGNFGMEKGHYELSVAIAECSLLPALRDKPDAVYLADGFSCRTQARQLAGRDGVHLATLLAQSQHGCVRKAQ